MIISKCCSTIIGVTILTFFVAMTILLGSYMNLHKNNNIVKITITCQK